MDKKLITQLISMLITEETKEQESQPKLQKYYVWEWVLLRWRNSGVHFGKFISQDKDDIVLEDSRRIWYWKWAFTLSALAKIWPQKWSKITVTLEKIAIQAWDICEKIVLDKDIANKFKDFSVYTP